MSLFISCKEATYLSSLNEEGKLSLKQKFRYFLHLRLCSPCKKFEKQMKKIKESVFAYKSSLELNPSHHMSHERKLKLQEELNKHR